MSQHLLLDRPGRRIAIGFDHPLGSFFGMALDDGIAIDGWPAGTGLAAGRPPIAARAEAERDLSALMAWIQRRLMADGDFIPAARDHAFRLRAMLLREWEDGQDALEIPLPAALKGPRP